jgi:tetratricopeptide (TPR) repeat protein
MDRAKINAGSNSPAGGSRSLEAIMDHENTANPSDLIDQSRAIQGRVMTPENSLLIRELLERALADPIGVAPRRVAETFCFLSEVLMCDYLNRWNDSGSAELAEAKKAVEQALEIVPDLAAGHYASGLVHRANGAHDAALAAFSRTVELNPEFALAHAQQGAQLIYTGRPLEARQPIETAIRISRPDHPSRPMFYWYLGRAHFVSGNYVEAIKSLQQSVEGRSNIWYNHLHLVSAYALTNDNEAAAGALRNFDDRFPNYTVTRVIHNEQANPHSNPTMLAARDRFHEGLRLAGMPD